MSNNLLVLAVLVFFAASGALAGESLYEEQCGKCHFEDDFADETKEEFKYLVAGIQEGKIRHQPSLANLSDADIEKLAEFFASQ